MKHVLTVILLAITCCATSQENKTYTITHEELKRIYNRDLQCADDLESTKEIAFSLRDLIKKRNDSLQKFAVRVKSLNDSLSKSNDMRMEQAVQISILKNKKTPWYKHWLTYLGAGLITGAWIAK